jgi:hypothetical protein
VNVFVRNARIAGHLEIVQTVLGMCVAVGKIKENMQKV